MYEIEYTPEGDDEVETSHIPVGSDKSDLELNVSPDFRTYLIRVRAYTELGAGPYSDTIEVLLEEDGIVKLSCVILMTFIYLHDS